MLRIIGILIKLSKLLLARSSNKVSIENMDVAELLRHTKMELKIFRVSI